MKEYGKDLEKQYKDLELKKKNLEAKILKRAKMIANNLPENSQFYKVFTKDDIGLFSLWDTHALISFIKAAEIDYVSTSKQTKLDL